MISGPLSYRVFRETGPRGPFLESPGKVNGPGIILWNQILKKSMLCSDL